MRGTMRWAGTLFLGTCGLSGLGVALGQKPLPPPKIASVSGPDSALATAQTWIGRALFVRGFYTANELTYDAAGVIQGTPKASDWTLAGIDIQSAMRKGPKEIELDGVRVAIRYNPDNRLFERHSQKDAAMKILVATPPTDGTNVISQGYFDRTLAAIFSVGIDPAMQRSMPDFWRHYFDPKLPWQGDTLAGQTIYGVGSAAPMSPEQMVKIASGTPPEFTPEAAHDHVQGTVVVRVVVDAKGLAQHLTVQRPLGYGLDAKAVEALGKTKFEPAQLKGTPVPLALDLTEEFKLVTTQQ
ncbi:TonB family protein [Granulicella sibirica]|uniref:Ferric siderophore transport system, periplasmic binding protein TonB n=1 Tax=Granulicella sibirica TaxID=2479048 RepID=A0A4Q0SV11_9BACT|nr:TonB family protein [Granulicella sibirica]RXH54885.1 Ferric siderophore transport system, periplasmic binding protein TonB [Granulicella sibirica]